MKHHEKGNEGLDKSDSLRYGRNQTEIQSHPRYRRVNRSCIWEFLEKLKAKKLKIEIGITRNSQFGC